MPDGTLCCRRALFKLSIYMRLAIVMPCYNEQEVLPHTLEVMLGQLERLVSRGLISDDSYIFIVDDGSKDRTWQIVRETHAQDPRVKGATLAHNRGQQPALMAGLEAVMDRCDACVTMDADLQDDPAALEKMIAEYNAGCEIVFGVRSNRDKDTAFKRGTAGMFYKFQQKMGIDVIPNHADYRLMSNRALHLLAEYGERSMYLRGVVPQLGLRTAIVKYARPERAIGESKYPLSKMIALAIDGVTSFTAKPMTFIFIIGLLLLLIDIVVAVWVMVSYFTGSVVSGWTSLILSVWFLGSLILMSIGILGEYIGKIYVEVKRRPRFAIMEEIFD